MSPVHVIVGDDPRAEAMWAGAFTGAVDLYRFERNVDAFERLTAAQAPIDLVVLTPAQRGPFNLTPDQFVARVLEGPLGSSSVLANLHVIVVGAELSRPHPRAMSVSTLEAAIRLVKFGEVERAPRPAAVAMPVVPQTGTERSRTRDVLDDISEFSGSIISRIWAAGDDADADEPSDDPMDFNVLGGGPAPTAAPRDLAHAPEAVAQPAQPPAPAALFSRAAPSGFVAAGGGAAMQPTAPVMGGGEVAYVGAPGEAIEVATGMLQPVRAYELEGGGAYRGPAVRNGVIHGAGHGNGGQPVPPALASQVESMVYGSMQVGNPQDPLLIWSSVARESAMAPTQVAAPSVAPASHVPVTVQAQPAPPQAPRTVPMQPPAGVYGQPAAAPQPQAQPAMQSSDPFLRRAEAQGGDVSFG